MMMLTWILFRSFLVFIITEVTNVQTETSNQIFGKKMSEILHTTDVAAITKRYKNKIIFFFLLFLLISINSFDSSITKTSFLTE